MVTTSPLEYQNVILVYLVRGDIYVKFNCGITPPDYKVVPFHRIVL